MAGRLIGCKLASRVMLAAAFALLLASPAAAGTLTLNFDAFTNGGLLSGCNLWTVTPQPGFSYDPPCSSFPLGMSSGGAPLPAGARFSIQTAAPPGIPITSASVSAFQIVNINNGQGWGGGSFYQGGAGRWHNGDTYLQDTGINSSYWGFAMICGWSNCPNVGQIELKSITLTATENTGPSLIAVGGNNLWYQGGHYIWNPPGDPFPLTLDSRDVSGVCSMTAQVGTGQPLSAPPSWYDQSVWQQCEERAGGSVWAPPVDTTSYVPGSGPLPLALYATNAAGVTSTVSETLSVDNDPVTVSLSTPNDPDPSTWVNHAVTVNATASAGPSGIGGQNCSVDGGGVASYPASGLNVDGTGTHSVSCTAWNNAVDPQGNRNSGTSSMAVHIDETPPSLSFKPQDPSAPTNVIVDAGDGQSGVAGGSIAIAPAGSQSWTSVPTTFDGQHLIGRLNDAGLTGTYVIRATSCDNVGNCSSTSEALSLPLRVAAVSDVSFAKIAAPAQVVYRRVLVGWHWQRIRINGTVIRARVGGHYETVRLVIGRNASCVQKRVQTGPHRWREIRACRALRIALVRHEHVGFGLPVTIHGALLTAQGVPIAGATVHILTSPDNGLNQFTPVATVTTTSDGAWSVKLPPGPSRTIAAGYNGSGRVLPATGQVTVSVPARVVLSITPRAARWGGTIMLSGRLEGGEIPSAGELVVLRIGWQGGSAEIGHLYTDRAGRFASPYTFLRGRGTAVYSVWATTARESDYPYAPGRSRRIAVTVHPG